MHTEIQCKLRVRHAIFYPFVPSIYLNSGNSTEMCKLYIDSQGSRTRDYALNGGHTSY